MTNHGRRNQDPLLYRVRILAATVFVGSIVFLVISDVVIRGFFGNTEFHVSDVMVGTLVGALIALLGIETVSRLPAILSSKNGNGKKSEADD